MKHTFILRSTTTIIGLAALGIGCSQSVSDSTASTTSALDLLQCSTQAGAYRTQTQGGWGARPSGGNSGAYLAAHFAATYPNGLSVGCGTKRLRLTSAAAVDAFLPSGGTGKALTTSLTDPGGAYKNVLAGQLVAATINVDMDDANESFGSAELGLRNLVIQNGPLRGKSVSTLLDEANNALGGCGSTYPLSTLVNELDRFNTSFHEGTTCGTQMLACPAAPIDPPPSSMTWVRCDTEPGLQVGKDLTVWGPGPNGTRISQTLACPKDSPHTYVLLPSGFDSVTCPTDKQAHYYYGAQDPSPNTPLFYAKNCTTGSVVHIDRAGGPAALTCPGSGQVAFQAFDSFGAAAAPEIVPCSPGSVVNTLNYYGAMGSGGTDFDPHFVGDQVICPAEGELHVSYFGSALYETTAAPASTSVGVWVGLSCNEGDSVDLTTFNF